MVINDTILDWFCLINTRGIGPKTFWQLMKGFGSARESLKHVGNPFPKIEAEKILKRMKCDIILASDKNFPKNMKRSSMCPPILFFKGDKSILTKKRKISIIGARNASIGARSIARILASKLSDNNFAIISGLAKGIDTSAHLGSLESISKSAVAIIPFGFDNIYPKENTRLCERIAENGIVLTEVPYSKRLDQGLFLARNRIISLISEGIIIIEAARTSGTMNTAKMALDFGCEVMVVPGSPLDPRNQGSNQLIKNGATLIQNHFDVIDAIFGEQISQQPSLPPIPYEDTPSDSNHNTKRNIASGPESITKQRILECLSEIPVSFDELSLQVKAPIQELLQITSELEVIGMVTRCHGDKIILTSKTTT